MALPLFTSSALDAGSNIESQSKLTYPSSDRSFEGAHAKTPGFDLNTELAAHQDSVFFMRVSGNSMIRAGIFENDLLLVDQSLEAKSGDIVVAAIDGERVVRRLRKKGSFVTLESENPHYPPIFIKSEMKVEILGVAIHAIHHLR